jgi:hypothetical protein
MPRTGRRSLPGSRWLRSAVRVDWSDAMLSEEFEVDLMRALWQRQDTLRQSANSLLARATAAGCAESAERLLALHQRLDGGTDAELLGEVLDEIQVALRRVEACLAERESTAAPATRSRKPRR